MNRAPLPLALLVAASLPSVAACVGAEDEPDGEDLGVLDGKSDGATLREVSIKVPAGSSRRYYVKAPQLRAELVQTEGNVVAEIQVRYGSLEFYSEVEAQPSIDAPAEGETLRRWSIRVYNRGSSPLRALLRVLPLQRVSGDPTFEVLFTDPQCNESGEGVRPGARCNGTEKNASRDRAGIWKKLIEVVDSARQYKTAHPEAPVTLYMAYLSWYFDGGLKQAVTSALDAGVQFRGYFDANGDVAIPEELEAMDSPNVRIGWLGGHTDHTGVWRLMHDKLTMVDFGSDAEPMWIVFSSANLSPSGSSVHFENFVFARAPRSGNFAQRHLCAMEALEADKYESQQDTENWPNVFRETYDACVGRIAAPEDRRFRVFFTPDEDREAREYLKGRMRSAQHSVDMAIEHYSSWSLASTHSRNAEDGLRARLVLDDQTLYMDGESSEGDHQLWCSVLQSSDLDIRYVRTNADIHQLQHNKYVVIDDALVFAGAGNFTESAFSANYENFYFLEVPELATQFKNHFEHLFGDLGSRLDEIPEPAECN